MEIPIWVASIVVGTLLGAVSFVAKLIFDHDRRLTRIESRLNMNGHRQPD